MCAVQVNSPPPSRNWATALMFICFSSTLLRDFSWNLKFLQHPQLIPFPAAMTCHLLQLPLDVTLTTKRQAHTTRGTGRLWVRSSACVTGGHDLRMIWTFLSTHLVSFGLWMKTVSHQMYSRSVDPFKIITALAFFRLPRCFLGYPQWDSVCHL